MTRAASSRRLPSFLVIGAMKTGTTSLYNYLRAHPQVHMPSHKEVDFFVEDLNWTKGFDWYAGLFSNAPAQAVALGEASTSYTKHPRFEGVPERIAEHLPDVRLLYVVRDPVERIRSHYRHNIVFGDERVPLEQAVQSDPSYLDYSRYSTQLDRYLAHFPAERILLLTTDQLRHDRRATMERVLRFIGVDAAVPLPTLQREFYRTDERGGYTLEPPAWRSGVRRLIRERVRPRRWRRPAADGRAGRDGAHVVPEDLRAWIAAELRDEVAGLRRHLGDEFDGWGIA